MSVTYSWGSRILPHLARLMENEVLARMIEKEPSDEMIHWSDGEGEFSG